jgi:hypothetical protein
MLVSIVIATGLSLAGSAPAGAEPLVACAPTGSHLVAWWTGDGNANDGVRHHDGKLVGGASFAPGVDGAAFDVKRSGALVRVPDARAWTLGNRDFTIDAWVNFASLPARGAAIVSHDEGAGPVGTGGESRKWIFWFDRRGHNGLPGNALRFHINSPTLGPIDTVWAFWTPALNHWYHVSVTRHFDIYRLFIDGDMVAKRWDPNRIPNAAAPLEIGAATGGYAGSENEPGGLHFTGLIDEVDVFNTALPGRFIRDIYLAGSAGKCAPS